MKREYDFSKGVRGKFYRKGAEIKIPVYLDSEIHRSLEWLAIKKRKSVDQVVNQLIKKELKVSR